MLWRQIHSLLKFTEVKLEGRLTFLHGRLVLNNAHFLLLQDLNVVVKFRLGKRGEVCFARAQLSLQHDGVLRGQLVILRVVTVAFHSEINFEIYLKYEE